MLDSDQYERADITTFYILHEPRLLWKWMILLCNIPYYIKEICKINSFIKSLKHLNTFD